MDKEGPRKAADLIEVFLDRIGGNEGSAYVGLYRSWRDIVGDRIADHTEPVDVKGTALVIEADHPGWIQMVMMSQQRIIQQLANRFPEIKINGLHLRVKSDFREKSDLREEAHRPVESPVVLPEALPRQVSQDEKEALENITDEELRESLSRLRESLEDKE